MKTALKVIQMTFSEWSQDQAPRLAAALAYYTIFSIGPFLFVIIFLAGLIYGRSAVEGQVLDQIRGLIGGTGADFIQSMIENSAQQRTGLIGALISAATILFGTLGVFGELQNTLNAIWNVKLKPRKGVWSIAKQLILRRLLSFAMVLGMGFLLVVSLVLTAVVSMLSNTLGVSQTGFGSLLWWENNIVLFVLIAALFALIFRILPDAHTGWREVIVGGVVTSLLFSLGRYLIGLFLAQSRAGANFGAAGALVILLLWIYYTAQIVFLGAEFTQVYANIVGSGIHPRHHAVLIREQDLIEEGKQPKEVKVAQPGPVQRGEERLRTGAVYWHSKATNKKIDQK